MQKITARVALVISALIATGVAASAADDLPPPAPRPVFTWTGFYIGANGGYGNAAFEDATVTTSNGTISRGGGGRAAQSSAAKLATIIKSAPAFSGSRPMTNGRGSRTQVPASSVGRPAYSRKRQKSHPSQPFAAAPASRLIGVCSTRPQEVSGPPVLTSSWQRSDLPTQPFLAATATRSDGRWGVASKRRFTTTGL